ncbi:glutaredoxin family protein [Arsukibacterium sp.]|uniref:glutaredoxin family protein n=1 Tax=Arsukibacterium sp. TaxID=1977258 RepID=UPI002FDAF60A
MTNPKKTNPLKIRLYSTWGCHLCEEAAALLDASAATYQLIDIIDDEQLLAQFRVHIPVVAAGDTLLYWPFDAAQLANWLKDAKKDAKSEEK